MKKANKLYWFYQKYLANKYVLAFFIFLIWILFLDTNNLIQRFRTISHIHKLEEQKAYYKERIEKDRAKLIELRSNEEQLEKFAREEYLMKKENEDVFVILVDEEE
ncbi:FtsB family cell division protein [Salinivirga cyanobacteriivorans]